MGLLVSNSHVGGTHSMRRVPSILLIVLVTGCASNTPGYRPGILTVAVSGNDVYVGRSQTDGSAGTFKLVSLDDKHVECNGHFRYNLPPNGTARFHCSNGDSGRLRIRAEGYLVGSGRGQSTRGPIEIVFGYSLKQANSRLKLPPGTELVWYGVDIALVETADSSPSR